MVVLYPKLVGIDRRVSARLAEIQPRIDLIEKLGIFAAASRPVVERLAGAVVEESFAAGDAIITEGAAADRFYVLKSGTVDVSALGEDGQDRFIRTMEPGSYFGEIGLIESVARTATVRAASDVEVLAISGDDFLGAFTDSPASAGFLEGAQQRLRITHPSRELTAAAIAGESDGEGATETEA